MRDFITVVIRACGALLHQWSHLQSRTACATLCQ